jgi:hypothetical protein
MAALAIGLTLAACSEPAGVDQGTAQVIMMNAAVGTPALDLVVGGKVIAAGVPFERTSAQASMPGGTQTLAIRRSGETVNLASKSVTITPNARYALIVGGTLASLTLTPALTPSVALDTGLAKPDKANIRIIIISSAEPPRDSSQQAPPPVLLDVYFTASGADLGPISPNLQLDARYSSYSTLIYFDPGNWVVRFTSAGTKTVVASTATIPIAAGQVRAVTLQRTPGGGFITSVVVEN